MKSKLLYNIILLCAINSNAYNLVNKNPDWMLNNITLDNFGVISALPKTSSVSIDNSVLVSKIRYAAQTLNTQQVAINNSFFLYPNPMNNKFEVSFGAFTLSQINIVIIDVAGRKINQLKNLNNNYSIDTHNLLNGLCFIKKTTLRIN